jgi:probable F420-dependent oxidoreductase
MMSAPHPFRFAVQAYQASSAREWTELARATEAQGYSALHLADHYFGPGPLEASTSHPVQTIAAMPAIAHAAAVTSTLLVGCRVFCVDYHVPAVLAKEAATLDLLSDGRLELGLGAGWIRDEYDALGVQFDRPGVRIDRLEEVVALVKAHFGPDQIDIDGRYVRVHSYSGVPKPVQHPRPPIIIGGGAKRVLTLAGREADIVSLNFDNSSGVIGAAGVGSSTAESTDQKIGWIRDGAGDRFDEIEIEIAGCFAEVTDNAGPAVARYADLFGLTASQILDHPNVLIGSVDAICDTLRARRERYGISYITVSAPVAEAFAPVVARLAGTLQ